MDQLVNICFAFNENAGEAVNFYVNLFSKVFESNKAESRIQAKSYYQEEELAQLAELSGMSTDMLPAKPGDLKTIRFLLAGQPYVALNGGPHFGKFSESSSLYVNCDTQGQIDSLWDALSEGGLEHSCGWLKDRFGISWQTAPKRLWKILEGEDHERALRVMKRVLTIKKIMISEIPEI